VDPIAQSWFLAYRSEVVDIDAPKDQVLELKRAFFAGIVYHLQWQHNDLLLLPEAAALDEMQRLLDELTAFSDSLSGSSSGNAQQ
jgi:hypothetical protein